MHGWLTDRGRIEPVRAYLAALPTGDHRGLPGEARHGCPVRTACTARGLGVVAARRDRAPMPRAAARVARPNLVLAALVRAGARPTGRGAVGACPVPSFLAGRAPLRANCPGVAAGPRWWRAGATAPPPGWGRPAAGPAPRRWWRGA